MTLVRRETSIKKFANTRGWGVPNNKGLQGSGWGFILMLVDSNTLQSDTFQVADKDRKLLTHSQM